MDNLRITEETWKNLANQTLLFAPRFASSLLVLLVFWLAASLVARLIGRVGRRLRVNGDVVSLFITVARVTLIACGVVTACGTLGIDVAALVAGLGLTGFAVGFAVKDIISNLLAGILILVYEPFRRGDRVKIGELEGEVVAIDFRYTTLSDRERLILAPNANLFTKEIVVVKKPASGWPAPLPAPTGGVSPAAVPPPEAG